MDRRSIIGFVIIATILTIMWTWNSGDKAKEAALKQHNDSIARVDSIERVNAAVVEAEKKKKLDDSLAALAAKDTTINIDSLRHASEIAKYGDFYNASKGENKPVTIENEKIKATIYPRGGRIGQVELKGVLTSDKKPLILFYPDSTHFGIGFFDGKRRRFNTDSLYFTTEGKSFSVAGKDSNSISFRLYPDNTKEAYIEYVYRLSGNSYMPALTINFKGSDKLFADDQSIVDLNWSMVAPSQEKSVKNQRDVASVYYLFNGDEKPDNLSPHEATETKSLTGELKWVSFKQQFFSSIIVADGKFSNGASTGIHVPSDPFSVKSMNATLPVSLNRGDMTSFPMHFYFGPNDFHELKAPDLHFERQIDLGWKIFGSINRYIFIPLFNWLGDLTPGNYGLAILLLTIIVKIVLFPVAYKSFLSSAKMRVLKPEMDVINEKHKDDPMAKQKATMALYSKAGVNPASGCIPLLLQIPVLFSLIRLFPAAYELRQQSFLWAHDLSTYDSVWNFGFDIPFYGDHMSLFALLMTISTLLYTWMNQQMLAPGSTQLPGMKWMIYLMPIFFLGFLNKYSSALSYYYFLSNIITFGQMFLMRRFIDEKAIHAKIEANKKKPAKKGGLMERLEKAQRDRMKLMQEQKAGSGNKNGAKKK